MKRVLNLTVQSGWDTDEELDDVGDPTGPPQRKKTTIATETENKCLEEWGKEVTVGGWKLHENHTGKNGRIYTLGKQVVKVVVVGWNASAKTYLMNANACYVDLKNRLGEHVVGTVESSICKEVHGRWVYVLRMHNAGIVDMPMPGVTLRMIRNAANNLAKTRVFSEDMFRDHKVNRGNMAFSVKDGVLVPKLLDVDDVKVFKECHKKDVRTLRLIYLHVICMCVHHELVPSPPKPYSPAFIQFQDRLMPLCRPADEFDTPPPIRRGK